MNPGVYTELYQYAFELPYVRLAVLLGIIFALIAYEYLSWTAGGLVTAGYFALSLHEPLHLLFSLGIALFTYLAITKVVSQFLFLWGRRKLSVMVLTAAALAWALEVGLRPYVNAQPFAGFHSIGIIIPGLIANDFERQGVPKTVGLLTVVTLVTYVSVLLVRFAVNALI